MDTFQLTQGWMREQFEKFNHDYFGGGLPEPRLSLSKARTRLGSFSCKRRRRLLRTELYDFTIRLSTYYTQTERDYQNTLLHEMIHFSIAYTRLKDTSSHGVIFRGMMDNLNRKYGWEIRVTGGKLQPREPASRELPAAPHVSQEAMRLMLALVTHDGRHMVTIVNSRYAKDLDRRLRSLSEIKSYGWYHTTNVFFRDFPRVRSLRGRLVSAEKFKELTSEGSLTSLVTLP